MKYVFDDINDAIAHDPQVKDRHKWRCYGCVLGECKCWVWDRSPSWAVGQAADHWGATAKPIKMNMSEVEIDVAFSKLTPAEQRKLLKRLSGKINEQH